MNTMKLKPFDLEAAKAGAKVVTRCGHPARILCADLNQKEFPVVVAVQFPEEEGETALLYATDGRCEMEKYCKPGCEAMKLFMAPTKRQGWVNLYKDPLDYFSGFMYDTEEAARAQVSKITSILSRYIATVPVEWEE